MGLYGVVRARYIVPVRCAAQRTSSIAENHLVSAAGVNYTYDGDGKRVMKSSGTLYWYGMNSDPLAETDLSNHLLYAYMFFNGKRVASSNLGNQIAWFFTDHLGSSRFVWTLGGWNISDFYPFGGERVISTGTPTHYKFTGKERDSESGLDNFGARYFGSGLGRFMRPDDPFADQEPAKLESLCVCPQQSSEGDCLPCVSSRRFDDNRHTIRLAARNDPIEHKRTNRNERSDKYHSRRFESRGRRGSHSDRSASR